MIYYLHQSGKNHFDYKQLLNWISHLSSFKFTGIEQLHGIPVPYPAPPQEKSTSSRVWRENLTHKLGQKHAWRLKT